jgi:hypothetical protein
MGGKIMNTKAFARMLGILALLAISLALIVTPSAAVGNPSIPSALVPLAESPLSRVNDPEGGGPVPGGPGHVILNAFDFKPFIPATSYLYTGTLLQNVGSGSANFLAPVHLPQGATINQVVAYYIDNDAGASKDILVYLLSCNDMATSAGIMASLKSSGSLAGVTFGVTSAITTPIVDNAIFSYAVQVNLPNSGLIGLTAVRIDYSYPLALPAVVR